MNLIKTLKNKVVIYSSMTLLALMFIFAGLLDKFFERHLLSVQATQMRNIVHGVLGQMDLDEKGNVDLSLEKLSGTVLQDAETEIQIFDSTSRLLWSSDPKISAYMDETLLPEKLFYVRAQPSFPFQYVFPFAWEVTPSKEVKLKIRVLKADKQFKSDRTRFKKLFWSYTGIGIVLLFFIQGFFLRWLLRPLVKMVAELKRIQDAEIENLSSTGLEELDQLQKSINHLIVHQTSQQKRYSEGIDNLAHSLKTPLTALRNMNPDRESVALVDQIKTNIDYHLRRAGVIGGGLVGKKINLLDIATRVQQSVEKAYLDKKLNYEIKGTDQESHTFSEGDLFELFGNLLDNASKWARSRVRMNVEFKDGGWQITIEDDGKGFPENFDLSTLKRGMRLDEKLSGQGIGLAVVHSIVDTYRGKFSIAKSLLGGALIHVTLPEHSII